MIVHILKQARAFAFIFLAILSASCNKDKDTENPVVGINSPYENQMFVQGGQLHLQADLSDNEEIQEYEVDIHKGSVYSQKSSNNLAGTWDTVFVNSASGTSFQVDLQVPVPALADTGRYAVTLTCRDKEGNEGSALKTFRIVYAK